LRRSRIDACIFACSAGEGAEAALDLSASLKPGLDELAADMVDVSGIVHLWIESYCTIIGALRSSIVFWTAFNCLATESGSEIFLRLSIKSAAGFMRTRSLDLGMSRADGPAPDAGSLASLMPAPPPFLWAKATAGMLATRTIATKRVRIMDCSPYSENGGGGGRSTASPKLQQTRLVCLYGRPALAMLPEQHERN